MFLPHDPKEFSMRMRFKRAGSGVFVLYFLLTFTISFFAIVLGMLAGHTLSKYAQVLNPYVILLSMHALFASSPYYGFGVYLGEGLGITMAVFLCLSMPLWHFGVIFLAAFVVSYVGTLLRVKRLKGRGYIV